MRSALYMRGLGARGGTKFRDSLTKVVNKMDINSASPMCTGRLCVAEKVVGHCLVNKMKF